jgi:hypothetical protein
MSDCGRGDETVHRSKGESAPSRLSHQVAPCESRPLVDDQNSAGEAIDGVAGQPVGKRIAAAAIGHQRDAAPDLGQSHDTDEGAILAQPIEPFPHPPVGFRPPRFGEDVRVEKKSQSSRPRGSSRCRSRSSSAPRSGELSRNSARVPLRGHTSDADRIWFEDEARIGQKNGQVRQWARRGTRPRQPADQRYDNAYLFGAICPARSVGAALALPDADAEAMQLHLDEISRHVAEGAHALSPLPTQPARLAASTLQDSRAAKRA